jgi:hypothetical protein
MNWQGIFLGEIKPALFCNRIIFHPLKLLQFEKKLEFSFYGDQLNINIKYVLINIYIIL